MKGDTAAALEFLHRWASSGPWVLTAVHPDRKGIQTRTFYPGSEQELRDWINEHQGERNVYFHVNPVTRDLNAKAEKEDILALAWLHVDIDPRAGEPLEQERERALRILTETLPQGVPLPTVVIDSGRGFQGFWRLREPLVVSGDRAAAESEAEPYNIQLERLFGADSCHNIDRIMRLPGTVNVPTAVKRRKGFKDPAPTRLVLFEEERAYDLSQFVKAPVVQDDSGGGPFNTGAEIRLPGNLRLVEDVDELPEEVKDATKVIIVQGHDPDDPNRLPSRSEWLLRVCCDLVRAGCSDDTIAGVILNPSFRISESVLESRRPEKYAARQIQQAKEYVENPMLRRLNAKHAVIRNWGGKCRVVEEMWDHALGRPRLTRQSFEDFRNGYMHVAIQVGTTDKGQPIVKPAGKWWLENSRRRQFETLTFAPNRELEGVYNLWKGFAVEPMPGDQHEPFLDHIRENICSGVEEHYRYLLGWMARAVQHPDRPGEVAVVLRGRMGTGKSLFAKQFGSLWGRHFLQVADPKHLVGSFNAHLRDTVVLFGDEAFYAGDKKHESILKMLVTEEVIVVEGKGVDAEAAPNFTHIILASNSQWVVPAGADERRFLVLEVGTGQMQQNAYFGRIVEAMDSGGRENLLHYLMTYDLSEYDVRRVPQTEALREQKAFSYSPEEQWWLEKLQDGLVLPTHSRWEQEVPKQAVQRDYFETMRLMGVQRRASATVLGKFLARVCPDLDSFQKSAEVSMPGPMGEEIRKMARPWHYRLPPLSVARAWWDEHMGGPHEWPPEPGEDDDRPF